MSYELWSQFKPYSPGSASRPRRPALDDYAMAAPQLSKHKWSPVGRSSSRRPEWDSDFTDYESLSLKRDDVPVSGARGSDGRDRAISRKDMDVSARPGHAPDEHVGGAPGLAHAWERHHVISWARVAGLGDLVAFGRQNSRVELLQLTEKRATTLKLRDDTGLPRLRCTRPPQGAMAARTADGGIERRAPAPGNALSEAAGGGPARAR